MGSIPVVSTMIKKNSYVLSYSFNLTFFELLVSFSNMFIPFNEKIIKDKKVRIPVIILITILPILIILGMYLLGTNNYPLYKRIGGEDNLIEWLQVLAYVSSSILAFLLSLRFRKVSKIMFAIFLILSLGFLFVAGEEISWGQRLFGIEADGVFDGETEIPVLKKNVQSETNLHNFVPIHSKVGYMYLGIGAYGIFSWFVVCILTKVFKPKKGIRKYLRYFTVPPYLFFYFFATTINLKVVSSRGVGPQEYELAELILSLGILITMVLYHISARKNFKEKNSSK